MFSQNLTLAQAQQQAQQQPTGASKIVLALVTADWCPPCQQLKRTTLRDARIEAWVQEHAFPVYIDADHDPAAQALNVTALPTMLMIRQGAEPIRLTGLVSADELLNWLNQ